LTSALPKVGNKFRSKLGSAPGKGGKEGLVFDEIPTSQPSSRNVPYKGRAASTRSSAASASSYDATYLTPVADVAPATNIREGGDADVDVAV